MTDQWQAAGGGFTFDNSFSTTIGGYPINSMVVSTNFPGNYWVNTVDNNTTNPDTNFNGSGWIPFPGTIDSPYTWGVHGTGTFSSLITALTFLSYFRITENGFITLNIPAGTFSYGTGVLINHPNADKIIINGASYTGGSGVSFVTTSGSGTLSGLRGVFGTELNFFNGLTKAGVPAISVINPGCTVNNLLVTSSANTFAGSQDIGILDVNSLLITNNVAISSTNNTAASVGITVRFGSICFSGLLGANWFGSPNDGIIVEHCGSIIQQPAGSTFNLFGSNNAGDGLHVADLANVNVGTLTLLGNSSNGFTAVNRGSITCVNANINNNTLSAGSLTGGSNFSTNSIVANNFNNNGKNAFSCQEGSSVKILSTVANSYSGNGATNLVATTGSYIDNRISGPAVTSSPASNTVGNQNSYVAQ